MLSLFVKKEREHVHYITLLSVLHFFVSLSIVISVIIKKAILILFCGVELNK